MKKIILKTTALLCIAAILIVILIISTNKLISKKALFRIPGNVDKIVLGHSHPECAFNDSLIPNFGNLSNSGESYFYTYFKLKQLIKQNKQVKTLFIEFSNSQFNEEIDEWIWGEKYMSYRYKTYAPFMDLEANKILFQNNPRAFLNSLSVLVQTSLNTLKTRKFDYIKKTGGYFPLAKQFSARALTPIAGYERSNGSFYISEHSMRYLKKIILTCKKEGIQVYLLRCPLHPTCPALKNEQFFQQYLHSQFSDIEFLDLKNFPLADDEFGDPEHLNVRGAQKFSVFFNELLTSGVLLNRHKQRFIDSMMESSGVVPQ